MFTEAELKKMKKDAVIEAYLKLALFRTAEEKDNPTQTNFIVSPDEELKWLDEAFSCHSNTPEDAIEEAIENGFDIFEDTNEVWIFPVGKAERYIRSGWSKT